MDCRSLGLLLINRNRESLTLKLENFIHSILKYARPDPDSVKIWFADFAVGPSGLNLGSLKLRFRVYRKFIVGGWRKVAKQWRKTIQ